MLGMTLIKGYGLKNQVDEGNMLINTCNDVLKSIINYKLCKHIYVLSICVYVI